MDGQPRSHRGPYRRFGELLELGIGFVAETSHQNIGEITYLLSERTNYSVSSIQRCTRGFLPGLDRVETMARFFYEKRKRYFDIETFLNDFLEAANFPDRERFLAVLFPQRASTPTRSHTDFSPDRYPLHNLRHPDFWRLHGREIDLLRLVEFLSPAYRGGVINICGIGGVGKSALALALAHQVIDAQTHGHGDPTEDFKVIIWVTAKREELLPQGIVRQMPTFTTVDELFLAVSIVLDLSLASTLQTPQAKLVGIQQLLSQQRCLLILDNFDTTADESLLLFLRDLPSPSKAILTTRHHVDIALPLHLSPLPPSAARHLLEDQIKYLAQRGYQPVLTGPDKIALLEATGGLPLAIVFEMSRLAWRGNQRKSDDGLQKVAKKTLYEFIFEPTLVLIQGQPEHMLLLALTLFPAGATLNTLHFMLQVPPYVCEQALFQLESLCFIKRNRHYFYVDTFQRTALIEESRRYPEQMHHLTQQWHKWILDVREPVPAIDTFPELQVEIPNFVAWLGDQQERKQLDQIARFYRKYHYFLYSEGEWQLLADLSDMLIPYAQRLRDDELLLLLLNTMLLGSRDQKDPEPFISLFEQLHEVVSDVADGPLSPLARYYWLRHMYHYEQIAGNAPLTLSEITTQMDLIIPSLMEQGQGDLVVEILNAVGNRYLKQRDYAQARERYEQALAILRQEPPSLLEPKRWQGALEGNIGIVLGRQGSYQEAIAILERWLPHFYEHSDLAEAYAVLAWYHFKVGEKQKAKRLRQKAEKYISRLSLNRDFCQENLLWMQQFA